MGEMIFEPKIILNNNNKWSASDERKDRRHFDQRNVAAMAFVSGSAKCKSSAKTQPKVTCIATVNLSKY